MVKIKDAEEFQRLLDALARDVVDAHIHFHLYRDLSNSLSDHDLVVAQSQNFWSLTLQAHFDTCIHRLSIAFDQEKSSLHLRSWLLTIKENLNIFDENNFRERLRDNPFVESLADDPRRPNEAELEADIASCTTNDPLVKTLMIRRGSKIAHRSAKNVVAAKDVGDTHPLTYGDVEALLDRAIGLLNKYSRLFAANTFSTQIVGHDDYRYIIESVDAAVRRSREQRAIELEKLSKRGRRE